MERGGERVMTKEDAGAESFSHFGLLFAKMLPDCFTSAQFGRWFRKRKTEEAPVAAP